MLDEGGVPRFSPTRLWLLRVLGVIFFVIGAILAAGGIKLALLGGSLYYATIGVLLIVSGVLTIMGRLLGLHLYSFAFLGTLIWSLFEAGLDGWALVPRLVGPFILLVLAILVMPTRLPNGKRAGRGYTAGLALFSAVGLVVAVPLANTSVAPLPLPVAQAGSTYFDDAILPAAADWPTYGGGHGAQRYSDLSQITPENVGQLKQAWVFRTGDIPKNFGVELTPLKIGDTLYGCTSRHKLFALDAATGKQKWMFDPKTPADFAPPNSACRGVAYYKQPNARPGAECAQRIIAGTLDAKLIAVDAATGQSCKSFGTNGHADLNERLGEVVPGMVSVTSAPTIVRGIVVTSQQVMDGQRRWAPSGVIRGYDAVTGQLSFAWDMEQPEITKLPLEGKTYTPGTPNMWSTAVADESLGLIYLPMANPAGDYYSSTRRPEERKYGSSVTALDVQTGKPRWVHQFVKNDVWDYDTPSQPSLVDFPTPEGNVPALVQTTKMGDIFILDRRTGDLLSKTAEVKVPQGGVEPGERSPIQTRSLYNTTQQPDISESQMWGISPIDQMLCRIQFRSAHYEGIFTPPSVDKPWIEFPGNNGGSDWGSLSVDVRRGVIVVNYNAFPSYSTLVPREIDDKLGVFYMGDPRYKGPGPGNNRPQADLPYGISANQGWVMPTGVLCKQPPYGGIRAIDLATGKTLWDHPLGTAQRNGPWGIPSMLPFQIGVPNNGGPVTTASGLIFVAATTDDFLRAIDLKTGKTVWQVELPAGGQAAPMIYEAEGKQYVVIMAGGHHSMLTPAGDYMIAYALPQ
ncbi:quinoprotein glucose dehydrogenase [Phyllobacterium trifolii]|uniref:Quinoprotein glucose dehydrogenase n=1 Tax=Phyllobacterium trifolii TaxID=300193 RepID=A0A839UEP0_9HYPH|nr:membrane-bound PQQ-dependent dehydrogenase, glucose/quinate/shikimate family [Phyllobacterium trifolii]MBB3149486.1 quinoprotein glucose dehydrogenase [Phyllobacterium trifolii]